MAGWTLEGVTPVNSIADLCKQFPGFFLKICHVCYDDYGSVRLKVDGANSCKEGHVFDRSSVLAFSNKSRSSLKIIREPPDGPINPNRHLVLCRADKDERTGMCVKDFCTFPHTELEYAVWYICLYKGVEYYKIDELTANKPTAPVHVVSGVSSTMNSASNGQISRRVRQPTTSAKPAISGSTEPVSRPSSQASNNNLREVPSQSHPPSNVSRLPIIRPTCYHCYTEYQRTSNINIMSGCTHKKNIYVRKDQASNRYMLVIGSHLLGIYFRPGRHVAMCRNTRSFNGCPKYGKCLTERGYTMDGACIFPHNDDERIIWQTMLDKGYKYLDDYYKREVELIINGKSQPSNGVPGTSVAASGDRLSNKASMKQVPLHALFDGGDLRDELYCRFCDVHCTSNSQMLIHYRSKKHDENVSKDSDREWKFDPPPRNKKVEELQICLLHAEGKGRCPSDIPGTGKICLHAHGEEMLEEWKERVRYRLARRQRDRNNQCFKYMDDLTEQYDDAEQKLDVVVRDVKALDIPGLIYECSNEPHLRNASKSEPQLWCFSLRVPDGEELVTVALWHDIHRPHFSLRPSSRQNDELPGSDQVADGHLFQTAAPNLYHVWVHFVSDVQGSFTQSLILDFGKLPVLEVCLTVDVAASFTEMSLELEEFKQSVISMPSWNEKNTRIVKCLGFTDHEKALMKKFPCRDVTEVITAKFSSMEKKESWLYNKHDYKDVLKRLVDIERMDCAKVLANLNLRTTIEVIRKLQREDLQMYPDYKRDELLFARVPLSASISEDKPEGRILFYMSYFRSIWVRPCNMTDRSLAFEFATINPEDNSIQFDGRQKESLFCVINKKVAGEMFNSGVLPSGYDDETFTSINIEAEIQFQLNELKFSELHEHLHLCDDVTMQHLFPEPEIGPYNVRTRADQVTLDTKIPGVDYLDERQMQFVKMALVANPPPTSARKKERPLPPLVVYGPFGMGKTFALGQTILQLLIRKDMRCRVLVCTWTNSAADIFILKYLNLCRHLLGDRKVLRLQAPTRRVGNTHDVVLDYCLLDDSKTRFRYPKIEELDSYSCVVSTVSTCTFIARLKAQTIPFTHIILDEAGQTIEIDSVVPLTLAYPTTRVIMTGDTQQMNPPVFSKTAKKYRYDTSPLERIVTYYWSEQTRLSVPVLPNNAVFFTQNYRNAQPILDFLTIHFYAGNRMVAMSNDRQQGGYPLKFCHCVGEDTFRDDSMSFLNEAEAREVVDQVIDLNDNWLPAWGKKDMSQICVIVPYVEQAKLIRRLLKLRKLGAVDVSRVYDVQGKEFRVVLISTVRTLDGCVAVLTETLESGGLMEDLEFGFITDRKLLNTAMSRAKSRVIVVGDGGALTALGSCQEPWKSFISVSMQAGTAEPADFSMEILEQETYQRQVDLGVA